MTVDAALATARKRIAERRGTLVDVSLKRRGSTRDPVTGERTLGAAVTVRARIEGTDKYLIEADGSLATAQYRVTLYGTAVDAGDVLAWEGQDHTVLTVEGLVSDPATGQRFNHIAVTD